MKKGFTLIELLTTVAIITILMIVTTVILNPVELLRESRDSSRVTDMGTLNKVVSLYYADAMNNPGTMFMGTSSVVYVSIPDPSATTVAGSNCSSLGLLTLPSGYTYHCAGPNYYRKVDGTGWIPVNFTAMSTGVPLGSLPTDPTNNSSSRLYYTYTTNGTQYEVTSPMESQKYGAGGINDVISGDGGLLVTALEKGSQLGLEPLDYGNKNLLGYWPLDEGTGSIIYDNSGYNVTGTLSGTPSGSSTYYSSPGGVGPYALYFDGTDNTSSIPAFPTSMRYLPTTISLWFNVVNFYGGGPECFLSWFNVVGFELCIGNGTGSSGTKLHIAGQGLWGITSPIPTLTAGKWYSVVITEDAGCNVTMYLNGALIGTGTNCGSFASSSIAFTGNQAKIKMDDLRAYKGVLSAAQIAALYKGGK